MDSGQHVWCACGAQWHGMYVTTGAHIVAAHKANWETHVNGCGEMAHSEFVRQYRCNCSQCQAERMIKRKLRRR